MKFVQFACGVESILFLISLVDLVFLLHLFFFFMTPLLVYWFLPYLIHFPFWGVVNKWEEEEERFVGKFCIS